MIVTTIKIHCLPQKRREVIQTIKGLVFQTVQDHGCCRADIYQDMHDQNVFYLMEEWQSVDALEIHKKSKSYAVLFGIEALLVESLEIKSAVKCDVNSKLLLSGACVYNPEEASTREVK